MLSVLRAMNTDDYEDSDRVRVWRSHVDAALFVAHYSVYGSTGLHAAQRSLRFEEFGLFSFAFGAHAVERTVELVERHPKSSLFLSLIIEGQAVHFGTNSITVLDPGDFVVYDPDQPYLLAFCEGTRQFFLDVPRGVLVEHGLEPTTVEPQKFDHLRQAASGVSASDVAQLFEILSNPTAETRGLNERIMRVLTALDVAVSSPSSRPHLARAMRFIRQNAHNAELDVTDIARAAGVSPRHLSREFRVVGKSPMHYVLEVRLDAAKELLANSTLSVTRIAQECGFSSPTSFTRAFTANVGRAPRAFRLAAHGLPSRLIWRAQSSFAAEHAD